MSWARLDDQFFNNAKVIDLPKDAKLLYLGALTHSAAQLTDGLISPGALRAVAALVDVDRSLASLLVQAGLWQAVAGGYQIHDYLEYNPTAEQVKRERAENARRQKEWREQKEARRNGVSHNVTNGVTQEITPLVTPLLTPSVTPLVTGAPSPSPSPIDPLNVEREREAVLGPPVREAPGRPVAVSLSSVPKSHSARAPAEPEERKTFRQEFWGAYPKRNGAHPEQTKAEAKLRQIPQARWPDVIKAARNYARSPDAADTRFVPHAVNWLDDWETWVDWEPPAQATNGASHEQRRRDDPALSSLAAPAGQTSEPDDEYARKLGERLDRALSRPRSATAKGAGPP